MPKWALTLMFSSLLLLGPSLLACQQTWIWARDDNSRPINFSTDAISLVLLEARVPSGDNFLASESSVGLFVDTSFEGSTADDPAAKREFPLMFEETADLMNDPHHPHSKNLSDQQVLIDYFPLEDDKTTYRTITIKEVLLRKQDPAVWTKVFSTLLTATKNLALPSPLTVATNYLSTFSTDVLQQSLPDPDKTKSLDLGTLSFIVSGGARLNRIADSGLYLRVFPTTETGDGWVDPNRWDSYCFYTKFEGANWNVVVAKKDFNAPDKDGEGCSRSKYTQLMNDYVPILIEVEQVSPKGGSLVRNLAHFGFQYAAGAGDQTGAKLDEGIRAMNNRAEDLHKAALTECSAFHLQNSACPSLRGRP